MSLIPEIIQQLALECSLPSNAVHTVLKLLSEGNTVPFIARYRKEATGNLDELIIRQLEERNEYLQSLAERKDAILTSIDSQGKLSEQLKNEILKCETKTALEDLYLPYKPKRRTRAMIAREKGLGPLAEEILSQSASNLSTTAALYINIDKGVQSIDEALSGARDIAAEVIAENAQLRAAIREEFAESGIVTSKLVEGKDAVPTKFELYYEFTEKASEIPSHRYLAIRRGESEGILQLQIQISLDSAVAIAQRFHTPKATSSYALELSKAIEDSCKRLLLPAIETDVRMDLKGRSDKYAIEIFATNVRNLLLAAPYGSRPVIGIDPGLRTGSKCAVVSATGEFIATETLFLVLGERALMLAGEQLLQLIATHKPQAIAIGNGTGGRETEAFVRKTMADAGIEDLIVVPVNESGASVYSASDCAREEFPSLDLTIRGAISIARRLQDPLAELVKVDPKAIGVGQYQHDVNQHLLQKKLEEVVESCVNSVGVELNTASTSLLSYVSGIGPSLAKKIALHRQEHGRFKGREQLLAIGGFGPRTYQQSAGFLRVHDGIHPLDSSAVHPERYGVVEKIANDLDVPLSQLIGNRNLIQKIELCRYTDDSVGELTLKDIIEELQKPGRDPRAQFEKPAFNELVHKISDLKIGMKLEGIITNVTAFGAFMDIGVHQDGLIHISELSEKYIKEPSEVVKAGDKLHVMVIDIDVERNRISLSAKRLTLSPELSQKPTAANNTESNRSFKGNKSSPNASSRGQGHGGQVQKKQFSSNPFHGL